MKQIQTYITTLQETLANLPLADIQQVIETIHQARLAEQQIFIMGNGGSASTASHFVCDLSKNTRQANWPHFRVIGLTDNMALLSAYANDEGYDSVFANQLANLARPGDLVIGISTSGNSPNVLKGVEQANEMGALTISLTGFNGGRLKNMTPLNIHVPSHCIEQVEDIHLMLEHLICSCLRQMASPS